MFTGIIEEVGTVRSIQANPSGGTLSISASKIIEGTSVGDSIAVNGACLTVTSTDDGGVHLDLMPETLRCTTTGGLRAGSHVNLERAMQANGRFGGHVVTGHVSGIASIERRFREGTALWLGLRARGTTPLLVPKGSIAIDGVSLTVSRMDRNIFWVSLIPQTRQDTILGGKRIGDRCNIEQDVMASYAARAQGSEALTMERLTDNGF